MKAYGYRDARADRHSARRAPGFRAKKLRTIGSDLGAAVRGFKKAMEEGDEQERKQLRSGAHDAEFPETPRSATAGPAEREDRPERVRVSLAE